MNVSPAAGGGLSYIKITETGPGRNGDEMWLFVVFVGKRGEEARPIGKNRRGRPSRPPAAPAGGEGENGRKWAGFLSKTHKNHRGDLGKAAAKSPDPGGGGGRGMWRRNGQRGR